MEDMNQALLAKAIWQVFQDDSGIWCKLLKHKYMNSNSFSDPELSKGVISSSTWKSIAFGTKLINIEMRWRVRCGERILFWLDEWVPDTSILEDHALIALLVDLLSLTVSDYLVDGQWLVQQLALVIPWSIVLKISSIHSGRSLSRNDRVIWRWSKNGDFSVKSAYGDFIDWLMRNLINGGLVYGKLSVISAVDVKQASIARIPPPEGWVKLNVDGSFDNNLCTITSSGVLRDHLKNWLRCFVLNKRSGNVLEAELWG
ncbi:hypothetical protein Dsin_016719 [Dipteronia sinensis]|uniref:Uncharacterized protein n=1 Tax=Dipteronia sinensis TaxID=43782 RepID=A0AAE0AEE1_9ROSI|nr:hypothetical protein Dsin_016719 [Dipteronia sinensis]